MPQFLQESLWIILLLSRSSISFISENGWGDITGASSIAKALAVSFSAHNWSKTGSYFLLQSHHHVTIEIKVFLFDDYKFSYMLNMLDVVNKALLPKPGTEHHPSLFKRGLISPFCCCSCIIITVLAQARHCNRPLMLSEPSASVSQDIGYCY